MKSKKIVRKIALNVLKLFSKDITITHHYTGDKVRLHSFAHKGYWFHGKNREVNTMKTFKKIISENDTIMEVGGHIGYICLYFGHLAKKGSVIVFEPGINNLPYLKKNVGSKKNIRIVEKGAGNENGKKTFYIESLTGQNNTFVKDFEGFESNKKNAGVDASYQEVTVEIIKLDQFINDEKIEAPNFIKIDVEGFEYNVLLGMTDILGAGKTKVMVEIQANYKEIYDLFKKYNYNVYDDQLNLLPDYDAYLAAAPNRFFIPEKATNA